MVGVSDSRRLIDISINMMMVKGGGRDKHKYGGRTSPQINEPTSLQMDRLRYLGM